MQNSSVRLQTEQSQINSNDMNQDFYISHSESQFWADFSFVDFSGDYLSSMDQSISRALKQMQDLEGGEIANPDENRMVGHYWLRNADLAPNDKLKKAIKETLEKVREVSSQVHSGVLQSPHGPFTGWLRLTKKSSRIILPPWPLRSVLLIVFASKRKALSDG